MFYTTDRDVYRLDSGWMVKHIPADRTTTSLSSLSENSRYLIKVQSENAAGSSPSSDVVSALTYYGQPSMFLSPLSLPSLSPSLPLSPSPSLRLPPPPSASLRLPPPPSLPTLIILSSPNPIFLLAETYERYTSALVEVENLSSGEYFPLSLPLSLCYLLSDSAGLVEGKLDKKFAGDAFSVKLSC